jgi:hypothetical protein
MNRKKEIYERKKERRNKILGASLFTTLLVGVITAMLLTTHFVAPELSERMWRPVSATGDPGAGASGMTLIFVYPHDADPGTTYATNLSTVSAYAYRNTWNGTLTGDVPYDTEFDIVIKARFNTTHAYNTTSSAWDMDYVKALITSADLSIGADTEMTAVQTATSDTYMWVQFYVNNAGSGYTRTHGLTTNVTSVKLQAFY